MWRARANVGSESYFGTQVLGHFGAQFLKVTLEHKRCVALEHKRSKNMEGLTKANFWEITLEHKMQGFWVTLEHLDCCSQELVSVWSPTLDDYVTGCIVDLDWYKEKCKPKGEEVHGIGDVWTIFDNSLKQRVD